MVFLSLALEGCRPEPQRSAEREHAVGEPQVEIEAQGAALERREGVHVDRDGVADDLVEEGVHSRNGKNRTLTELCSSWSSSGFRQQVQ